ncbi:hypothetical protein QFC22_006146 [Naganishia vaughanmartiniae]|uniref:Uncharacterized protein n=1 Tax=Naganishia vaughanmartiniae TaxID=1424756 RepID=A0ACC2WMP6_9TREE|nr:hypothetical protein QFC22_006146 [Naganishia vaughanmartiniae]
MHRPTVSPSGNRRRPRHSTRASSIRILKPVNIKTLELLLRIPLLWESVNGHGGSNSMPRYQFIDHIKSIDVDALQSVHGDNMMCEQTTSSSKLGNIDTTFNLSHPNPTSELRETIKHLLGLVVTAAASSQSRVDCEEESKTPRLHFRVKEGGGPVAQLVNEICNQPLPGGFWPFVTMDI